jgi:hypothetical protein
MNNLLPFASTLIIFIFAFLVFRRYARRRGTHLLIWGVGLIMFGVGSFAEAYSALDWNPTVFRLWYLGGAVLNAAWLGQGTVYLLLRRRVRNVRVAHILLALLIAGSLFATYALFTTPLDPAQFSTDVALSDQYRDILPQGAAVRLTTPFFNIYGLITLVGGAIYSAWLFWRKRIFPNRVIGNVLIAVGALSIGFASVLTRLGFGGYLYLGELLASALMLAGFMKATQETVERKEVPAEAALAS